MTAPADDPDFISNFNALLNNSHIEEEQKLLALEQAIQLADAQNNLLAGMMARVRYIRTAEFAGRYDQTLVCFTWCLAIGEKNPPLFLRFKTSLLWFFKWIACSVPRYPGVSRPQIESTLAQMIYYYNREGISHRAIHGCRAKIAAYLGDTDQVPVHRDAWLAAPLDGSQDCAACEAETLATLYLATGELEKAVDAAEPLLAGRLKCAEQPFNGQSLMLLPLFHLGRFELADSLQRKSAPKIRAKAEHLFEIAGHIAFLTATDQLTRALNMFEEGLRQFSIVRRPWDRMHLLGSSRLLFLRLIQTAHPSVKLRLPPTFELYRPDNQYTAQSLYDWCDRAAFAFAADFDRRNGNIFISTQLRSRETLLDKIHPLTRKAAGDD